jgi:hypothetical protein
LQGDHDGLRGGSAQGKLDEERSGDGIGKVPAKNGSGRLNGQSFERIALDEMEAGLVLEIVVKERDEALVHLEGFDPVAGGEEGVGEGSKAGTDLLHRFRANCADGLGDLGRKGGLGEEVLAQLAEGAEAAGGQDFLDPGGVQSWRWRMACSSPGLRMPCTSSEPLP